MKKMSLSSWWAYLLWGQSTIDSSGKNRQVHSSVEMQRLLYLPIGVLLFSVAHLCHLYSDLEVGIRTVIFLYIYICKSLENNHNVNKWRKLSIYNSPLNPHFLILRDCFPQLRSPEDECVVNCTGLSGQETSGQNYILDSCFQPAYKNNVIFTINSFTSFLQVTEIFLTGGNSLNIKSLFCSWYIPDC